MTVIGFLGFGEAGSTIARGLRRAEVSGPIVAYDLASGGSELMRRRADQLDVELLPSATDLANTVDVLVSAVVCTEAERACHSVADALGSGTWYLDINSVAPSVKRQAAALLEPREVHYVDVAVMGNVTHELERLPLLLAGRAAARVPTLAASLSRRLVLDAEVVSDAVGDAARIKVYRSLFVKGLEALSLEVMTAAHRDGVHEQVLTSFQRSFGHYAFPELVQHLLQRHAVHGARRAEELREVAATLAEAGVEPIMAEAGRERMLWDVERGLQDRFQERDQDPDWRTVLAVLTELGDVPPTPDA